MSTSEKTVNNWLMIRVALTLIWLGITACSASAQSEGGPVESSRPTVGGTLPGPELPPPTFGASAGTEILRHRNPAGRPCLAVDGFARPQTMNPNLYDHVISVTNSCAQRIGLKVCYYQTQECISMEVPGDEDKIAILGTMPSTKDFRFEFREKF